MKSLLLAAGLPLVLAGCGAGEPTGGPFRRLDILSAGTLATGGGATTTRRPTAPRPPPATAPPGAAAKTPPAN
jgi:hypothetical protein